MMKSLIIILTIVLLGRGQTSAVAQTTPATGPEQAPVKVNWDELDGFMGTTPDLFLKAAREGDLVSVQQQLPSYDTRDWPFPANALVFWNRLHPLPLLDLMAEQNLFLRDFHLKQALGLPPESFALATDVLAVDHDAHFPDRR